jgi:hypothetical protein
MLHVNLSDERNTRNGLDGAARDRNDRLAPSASMRLSVM